MVPPCDVIRELARVVEVDPGWLAFGGEMSAAPAPRGWAPGEASGPAPGLGRRIPPDDDHSRASGDDEED